MARTGLQSACPQCGAPLRFGGAHSLVSVCAHCRSAVARADADVSLLGRMPDLVTTDSRLELGLSGKLGRQSFSVLGRLQLQQGRASWEEWYVSWSDGSFGWLAEARGRLIVTHRFEHALEVPPIAAVTPGAQLSLSGIGLVTVEEVGEARFVSAQGELPFWPSLDATYKFVDASTPDGGYVTLDYGTAGDGAEAFVGRELSYSEAGLADQEPHGFAVQVRGQALQCPQCGAPLSLKAAESVSVVCESCRALCALTDGKLALLAALKGRPSPALPLGARAELLGEKLEVIGWVERTCEVDGTTYTWSEYLLHGVDGYRWLSEANGHWTLLKPLAAARAATLGMGNRVEIDGRMYKHFQSSRAVAYASMQGEFYWRLDPNDRADMDDFVAPPYIASREQTQNEVNWSIGQSIAASEVWRAFGQQGAPPAVNGVGPCEVNPHKHKAKKLGMAAAYGLALIGLLSLIMLMLLPRAVVVSMTVPTSGDTPVTLSEPFEIRGATHALEIYAYSPSLLHNAWVGLDVALINDVTGESDALGLELSHYTGVEDGESWSEGSSSASGKIGSVAPGRYVLRVEPQIEWNGSQPSDVQVRVTHGVFLWFPLLLALCLLGVPALILRARGWAFEVRRWSNSDHPLVTVDES